MAARRNVVNSLIRSMNHHSCCPCHTCKAASSGIAAAHDVSSAARALMSSGRARTKMMPATRSFAPASSMQQQHQLGSARGYATPVEMPVSSDKEYAFEVSAANLRFGEGVTVSAVFLSRAGSLDQTAGNHTAGNHIRRSILMHRMAHSAKWE